MSPALIAIALQAGAPLVEKALAGVIGGRGARLATEVLQAIAGRAGATVDDLDRLAAEDPARLTGAMQAVEAEMPELIALYGAELAARQEIFRTEAAEPLWVRAWRPLGMYGLGFLWYWNLIFLHVANAIWKTRLPPVDAGVLMELTMLYMGLYMGGHTVKDMMSKWSARRD